ncbi:uncharacterized protein B0T15DRAFT_492860 [Chaetomium strumarium]|uniref:Uncharacterized protein n=1 Tax=Chaetomium strumarium TaxID=1170767 RepID=A0AAJ0GWZ5_9PEZI|nr:hypothetical protein B0T15DRAFT_492860 [Chaetomium strumarium]
MLLTIGEDKKFASNLAAHLGKALPQVQKATIETFNRVDREVEEAIQRALDELESKDGAGIEHKTAPLAKQVSRG